MSFQRKGFDATIGISFLLFVILGLPSGLLGLAWPSIREEFNLPLDAIGPLLMASTVGFLFVSFNSGMLVQRFGIGRLLVLAGVLRGGAMLAVMVVPSWPLLVLTGLFQGAGAGIIDTGLNTYVATYQNNRLMNWLHAAFGLGATIGPLLMTALFNADISWRWGYGLAGIVQLSTIVLLLMTLPRWQVKIDDGDTSQPEQNISIWKTLRLPLAWIGIGLFFFCAGLEMSAGQWAFTLFTEDRVLDFRIGTWDFRLFTAGRGIDESVAGIMVSVFWASFTIGRIFFGMLGDDWQEKHLLRTVMAVSLISGVMISIPGYDLINFIGLTALGFAMAPIFPLLINSTAARIDPRHVPNTIGLQVGMASAGTTVAPWLIGLFAENIDLETIGPMLVIMAVGQFVLYELLLAVSVRQQVTVGVKPAYEAV